MSITTEKISDNEIKVIKTETEVKENTFTYEYLVSQKESIQAQKDRDNALRNAEIAEVDALLAECGKLSITVKPEEPVV